MDRALTRVVQAVRIVLWEQLNREFRELLHILQNETNDFASSGLMVGKKIFGKCGKEAV